jgi:hypothetical protein
VDRASARYGERMDPFASRRVLSLYQAVSVLAVAYLNWVALYLVGLHEAYKEKTCFVRCYAPAHIGWATPLIFFPTLFICLAVVASVLTRFALKGWTLIVLFAFASLAAVTVATSLNPDLLSFVPPWDWLRNQPFR